MWCFNTGTSGPVFGPTSLKTSPPCAARLSPISSLTGAVFGFRRPPPAVWSGAFPKNPRSPFDFWESLLVSGSLLRCLRLPPTFPVEAVADACASEHAAGLGGFVRLSSGQCLCFQHQFTPSALLPLCPWLQEGESLQSYICCWELLAQCALLLLLHRLLPPEHPPVHILFRCDNATAEAASWKGLSMAKGL